MIPTTIQAENLKALVDILFNAVNVVTTEYAKGGHLVPSLDSTEPGPFDAPENVSPALFNAVRTIEAACAQLSFVAVASPGHVMTNNLSYGYYEPSALLVVCNAKVADILLDKPDGMHISEIAKASGLNEGKLGRIIRMLVTKHCFREVKPDIFANNRLSIKLLSTDPVSACVGTMTDEVQKGAVFLNEALFDPESGHSSLATDTAFKRAHGYSFFDYYGRVMLCFDVLSQYVCALTREKRFSQAMVGWGAVTGKGNLSKAYPWSTCRPGTTVCDIGGGNGHIMLDLIKSAPQLKAIIQDTPTVIEHGKELWGNDRPDLVQSGSVRFKAIDFFKDTPVACCDFYYLRHVLHDWPDFECFKILQNIRNAAQSSSKLLLHEFVLQHAVRGSGGMIEEAPEPLLPNFGMGHIRLYQQDMNMMNLFNSGERTLQEFIKMRQVFYISSYNFDTEALAANQREMWIQVCQTLGCW
ncbi:hypothetical protein D9757_005092 [Collybiopsis confluens]|uniref:O-methyltransferase domain-containing protein n=1 Tax=Collybiopsis confluens TaxID=2823264 RepID=A0A8H5HSW6_9AGAR|nr:hypothetical protein D9757_015118 [Collybiopsis confluens]KAF5388917.1 hypothetical protein D9757_005092 [Collybiopsis confluens]